MTDEIKLKPLSESLLELLEKANGAPLAFKEVVETLKGRGAPVFLIILTLPFSLPMSIPGLSTPFGLVIAFMGLRYALGRHLYWPQWVLKKQVPYPVLKKIVETSEKWLKKVKKYIRPRLVTLTQNIVAHRLHGLFMMALGLLLALPLPVPFTNYTCSIPLICLGLGLLEDDGVLIIISYILGFLSFAFWTAIILYGQAGVKYLSLGEW